MRIPDWWHTAILVMAAYRLLRFISWDDWPPILKARGRIIGERWIPATAEVEMPGKTPSSEVATVRPVYDRPLLAHLLHCPFCAGWWVCLFGWFAWLAWPHAVTFIAVPWAASGAVGLISKNWDP